MNIFLYFLYNFLNVNVIYILNYNYLPDLVNKFRSYSPVYLGGCSNLTFNNVLKKMTNKIIYLKLSVSTLYKCTSMTSDQWPDCGYIAYRYILVVLYNKEVHIHSSYCIERVGCYCCSSNTAITRNVCSVRATSYQHSPLRLAPSAL